MTHTITKLCFQRASSHSAVVPCVLAFALAVVSCRERLAPVPVDPDVDDSFAIPSATVRDGVYISKLQNPALGGTVRFSAITIETLPDGRRSTCCERITVGSDGSDFLSGLNREFVSIRGSSAVRSVETGEDGVVWMFRTPALLLPSDGSAVTLTLARYSGRLAETTPAAEQTIRVALDSGTIVLPVHVHVFVRPGRSPSWLTERQVQAALERADLFTTAESVRDPTEDRLNTHIVTEEVVSIYRSPDDVWSRAGIQFQLMDYEIIPQEEQLELQLVNNKEASASFGGACRETARVHAFHRERMHAPGIHVYVGGGIDDNELVTELTGATCGAFARCGDSVSRDDLILLDEGAARRSPLTLAHELGHFLGLHHTTETVSCGGLLVTGDDTNNLMRPLPVGGELTDAQIARARLLACAALRLWGVSSSACP